MQILRKDIRIIAIVVACIVAIAGIMTSCEVRKARRMQEALELALEQNRNGIPFTSDTIYLSPHSSPTSTPFPSGEGRGEAISLRRVAAYYNAPVRRFLSKKFNVQSSQFNVRALYALGCVYRDLHEAPIALLTWEDAIAAADTTSTDCDYATLFRVYGQMADIYYRQYMPEKLLDADQKFCKYALMAGDTLLYSSFASSKSALKGL